MNSGKDERGDGKEVKGDDKGGRGDGGKVRGDGEEERGESKRNDAKDKDLTPSALLASPMWCEINSSDGVGIDCSLDEVSAGVGGLFGLASSDGTSCLRSPSHGILKRLEQKRKHNLIAKRSRDSLKRRKNDDELMAEYLELENGLLKGEVENMQEATGVLQTYLINRYQMLKFMIESLLHDDPLLSSANTKQEEVPTRRTSISKNSGPGRNVAEQAPQPKPDQS